MLIGHLPAGYLASTVGLGRLGVGERLRRRLMTAGLVASVAPDLDLLYFYGVDSGVHHHAFPTHWPIPWVALLVVGLGVAWVSRSRAWALGAVFAGAGGLLHILLDTIAGEVRWLAPFSEWSLTLVTVPPRFDSWILSFVTHWTFGVEIALWIVAIAVWRWRRTPDRTPRRPLHRLGAGLAVFAVFWAWLTYDDAPPAPDHDAIEAVVGVPLGEPTFKSGSPLQRAADAGRLWWTLYRLPIPNQMAVGTSVEAWTYSFETAGTYALPAESPLGCHTIPEVETTCGGTWNGHTVLVHHATASGQGRVTVRALPE